MAQYKVPQDVEADDKLIGPFNFRQFVYLLVSAGLIALAVGLFQLVPPLAIIPLLPTALLLALALPLKKDQPMEAYLAAVVSFYLKPNKRKWTPGQKDTTILITAPKKVEEKRVRSITGEEATNRLSFLADIVDTEGYAIKGAGMNSVREDLVAEANATQDMFDTRQAQMLSATVNQGRVEQRADAVKGMQEAVAQVAAEATARAEAERPKPEEVSSAVVRPNMDAEQAKQAKTDMDMTVRKEGVKKLAAGDAATKKTATKTQKPSTKPPKDGIIELANNSELSVATIAKEANRINRKDDGEVFISLH